LAYRKADAISSSSTKHLASGSKLIDAVTADEVDEQANRRADYILSVEPPVIKKGATPAWKAMSKGCSQGS